MFGKQGWKFLTNFDTLVTKFFKARYFAKCDFLKAGLSHNPSVIWRGIRSSQTIITMGYRWRIGTCATISVWDDPWLRDSNNLFVETAKPPDISNLKV